MFSESIFADNIVHGSISVSEEVNQSMESPSSHVLVVRVMPRSALSHCLSYPTTAAEMISYLILSLYPKHISLCENSLSISSLILHGSSL